MVFRGYRPCHKINSTNVPDQGNARFPSDMLSSSVLVGMSCLQALDIKGHLKIFLVCFYTFQRGKTEYHPM